MKRAVLVVNPTSGSGGRANAIPACEDELRGAGWAVETHSLHDPGEGARVAEAAARDGADAVIAAGGDGTVRGVATGLLASGSAVPLGILPTGTANLLARDLGLPADGREGARIVLAGHTGDLDVAEANGTPFLCCLGVGFDAYVIRRLAERRTGHIHVASYVRPLLHALRRYAFPTFHVTAADGTSTDGVLLVVLNTPSYGGVLRPSPDARPDDGVLDAVVAVRGGRRCLPRWLLAARRGTLHAEPDIRVLRSASFRVTCARPLPFQVDGEVGAATPVAILTRPSALRVLRPPEPRP